MQRITLHRERIDEIIQNNSDFPVLFVSAPIGYGKSTAVRHYLQSKKIDAVWVSALSNSDDERVWKSICDEIVTTRGEAGRILETTGFPVARFMIPKVIEALKVATTKPLVIVIDDCHLFADESPMYHILFAIAIEQIPGLQIICITRGLPNSLAVELRTKQLCSIISTDTLAFTKPEVASYLRLHKSISPSAAHSEKIWEASEGWIAAVVLLAEGMRQGREVTHEESLHDLFEYILFQRLTEEEQNILTKLSILESFTISQAEIALESDAVKPLIERLYSENAFISREISTNIYRMHTLLRSFLAHKADAHNVDTSLVVLNLARWSYLQGQYILSFKYYHQCGHSAEFFERLTISERHHVPFEYQDAYYDIFKSIPLETSLDYPLIYTYMSLFFLASGDIERERFALKCIGYLHRHFVRRKRPHSQLERITCELQVVFHLAHFNNPYKLLNLKRCTLKHILKEVLKPVVSTTSMSAGLPSLLFCLYRTPGELDTLIAFAETHFDCDSLGGLGYGFDKLLHAEKHLERWELDKARFYAEQAIQKGWLKEQMHIIACAHSVLLRIAVLNGKSEEAIAHLDIIKFEILAKLTFTPTSSELRVYAMMGELCEIYIYSMMNNGKRVASCMCDMQNFGKTYSYNGLGMPFLFKIKYKIITHQFSEAEVLCDYYDVHFKRYPTQLGALRSKIFRAIVTMHLYDVEDATQILVSALEQAAQDMIIAPFAESAGFILPLLDGISSTERLPEAFLGKVKQACLDIDENLRQMRNAPRPAILSRREIEVFKLLAQGESQRKIASILNISALTVKRHVENIYTKLKVSNRVAALNKGHMLGF